MTYGEKLKNPEWQKKRLEILSRDKWTCVDCGSTTKTLHVHHSYYIKGREPWEYPSVTLTTLCVDCHRSMDGRGGREREGWELILSYLANGPSDMRPIAEHLDDFYCAGGDLNVFRHRLWELLLSLHPTDTLESVDPSNEMSATT